MCRGNLWKKSEVANDDILKILNLIRYIHNENKS